LNRQVWVIGMFKRISVAPAVMVLLVAMYAAGEAAGQQDINKLIEQLGSEDTLSQLDALKALVDIGNPAVDPLINALTRHSDYNVRKNAAITLGMLEASRAVPHLINALNSENSLIRMCSAWALGEIGDESAIDNLCRALKDSAWTVRMRAAEALGRIGNNKANAHLFPLLRDSHEKVREAVKKALAGIKS
jgi:bilin biosynthesis protein